jgi:hypothetical protein
MKHRTLFAIPLVMLACVLWSQSRTNDVNQSIQRVRDLNDQTRQLDSVDRIVGKRQFSKDGQWQMSEIQKAQYTELTSDTEKLTKLTNELKLELNNPNVLSVGSMRKAEEIEKLAKKVRSRLRGWF